MGALLVRRFPLLAGLVLAATLGAGSASALAQTGPAFNCSGIQFELANPSAGARLDPGAYVVQGVALDTRAEGGPGIDRVDFFLGNREQGGMIVGHATPLDQGPLAANSFETTITLPNLPGIRGGQELFGYAHSAVTGEESIVSVPIAVGVDPSRAGDVLSRQPQTMCLQPGDSSLTPGEPAVSEPAAPAQAEPTPAQMVAPDETGSNTQMFLDVGNPRSGDAVHVGGLMIEGIAFDRAAEQGAGIERIDIFLDNRDAGGSLIGHAVLGVPNPAPDDPDLAGAGWAAQVNISNRMTGPHTMFFYALSAVTGEEMVVGVPVEVVP